MIDSLGDRMKRYEAASTSRVLLDHVPAIVRVDGRAFHTFTRGMETFHAGLIDCMESATRDVLAEFVAAVAFVQSDEASFLFFQSTLKSELPFNGRVQKIESVIASAFTLAFNRASMVLDEQHRWRATFDARAWSVPNREEAGNYFLWRERDATKNSIASLAQSTFSHKQLHGKHTGDMMAMLEAAGIRWDELEDRKKRGSFFRRGTYEPSPGVIRSRTERIDMPPFGRVTNRAAVLFDGETPFLSQP